MEQSVYKGYYSTLCVSIFLKEQLTTKGMFFIGPPGICINDHYSNVYCSSKSDTYTQKHTLTVNTQMSSTRHNG